MSATLSSDADRRSGLVQGRLVRLLRDTVIVIGVSFSLIVCIELFLRLLAPQSLIGWPVAGERFTVQDPWLGMRYIPQAVWHFRHPEYRVEYAINNEGFRDATTRNQRKPSGVTRVLLLGDSFTFGQGVNYEQSWPVMAEKHLQQKGLAVDLIKAGMQGADTRSELVLLRRLVERYDPDAVVVAFLINDLYTNIPYRPPSESVGPDPELVTNNNTVFKPISKVRTFHLLTLAQRLATANDAVYIAMYLAAPGRGEYLRIPLARAPRRQLEVTQELFRQMAAICDSLGKPLSVLSLPQQFQVLYVVNGRSDRNIDVSYYDRYLGQFARASGIEWIPTLQAFATAAKSFESNLFYRLDGHFTSAGNAVAARIFVDRVMPSIMYAAQHPASPSSGSQNQRSGDARRED